MDDVQEQLTTLGMAYLDEIEVEREKWTPKWSNDAPMIMSFVCGFCLTEIKLSTD